MTSTGLSELIPVINKLQDIFTISGGSIVSGGKTTTTSSSSTMMMATRIEQHRLIKAKETK